MASPNTVTTANTQPLGSNQAIRLIGSATGVNVNATGDQAIIPVVCAGTYSAYTVIFTNASVNLTTAAAGLFTAPAAGGTAIVSNAALSAMSSSTVVSNRTVASTAAQTGQNLYLNVGTAQGAAATMDVFIYGYVLA